MRQKADARWKILRQRLRPKTFRARITLAMTLLALTILTLVDILVYMGRHSMFQNSLDATLLSLAQTESASAMGTLDEALPTPGGKQLVFSLPTSSTLEPYIYIEDANGHIIAHSENLRHLPFKKLDHPDNSQAYSGNIAYWDVTLGSQPMRSIRYPFINAKNARLVAIIAISEEPMISTLRSLNGLLGGSLLFGGFVFAVASSRLSLRLTRPLARIAAVARDVGETNLNARIPEVSPDTELRDVTQVLNDMLNRLETAFAQQQELVSAQQRFVTDASHELRSPLSNLRGTVEVALRRPRTSEDYQETLAVALKEIQRLSRLVEDLLTLSRADAAQFPLNIQPCDLGHIVRNSAQVYSVRAEQSRVELAISILGPTPLHGDRDRLRQVVDNLLDNALKYAPPDSSVDIAVHRQGQECRLEVSNQGPAIPPDDAARIFHRFYRTDLSRTRASGGAGLGLSIAQAIVQAHGGSITVDSGPRRGATFRVLLPAIAPGETS